MTPPESRAYQRHWRRMHPHKRPGRAGKERRQKRAYLRNLLRGIATAALTSCWRQHP